MSKRQSAYHRPAARKNRHPAAVCRKPGSAQSDCVIVGAREVSVADVFQQVYDPVAGSILVFIPCIGAYVTPRVLGGGKNMMLGSLIEQQFGQARDWPSGSALSITLLAVVMMALLLYVRNAAKPGDFHDR